MLPPGLWALVSELNSGLLKHLLLHYSVLRVKTRVMLMTPFVCQCPWIFLSKRGRKLLKCNVSETKIFDFRDEELNLYL